MREAENIREVEALGIDWLGLIFWPHSSRYVSECPDYLPRQAKRVGVFVDEDTETIKQVADDYALDIIQLHGHESPEQISHLSPFTSHLSIIKAFSIATASDLNQVKDYEGRKAPQWEAMVSSSTGRYWLIIMVILLFYSVAASVLRMQSVFGPSTTRNASAST